MTSEKAESRAREAEKADRRAHEHSAAAKRARKAGLPVPGKYVVEVRRVVTGIETEWAEAEYGLPGNPVSSFGYRCEAEALLLELKRNHPSIASGQREARLRIVRRSEDDPAPPVALALPREERVPTIAELVREEVGPEPLNLATPADFERACGKAPE